MTKFKFCWKSFLLGIPFTVLSLGGLGYASKDAIKVFAFKKAGLIYEQNIIFAPKDKVTSFERASLFNQKSGSSFEYVTDSKGTKLAYSCLLMKETNPNQEVTFLVGGLQGPDDPLGDLANIMVKKSNVCLILPSGYGPSEGIRLSKEINDSVKFIAEHIMAKHKWDYKNLKLFGYSAGALPMTSLALSHDVKGLYLYHPVVSWGKVAGRIENKQTTNVETTISFQGLNYEGSTSLDWMLERLNSPTKIVIAINDNEVDPSDQFQAAERLRIKRPDLAKVMVVQEDNHWSFSPQAVADSIENF
jgi:hypothetical protein